MVRLHIWHWEWGVPYCMAGLLTLVARHPLDVPSHAAVSEDLLHLRDFQTGHLHPLARVWMPEAVVPQAPIGRILREAAAAVFHVHTSLPWAGGSRGLSWNSNKGEQKPYHTALVHDMYRRKGLTPQRNKEDGEDCASGVSPEPKT